MAWFLFVLILLCLPGSTIPKYPWLSVIYADKWIHIILFYILCVLFSWPFRNAIMVGSGRQIWFLCIAAGGVSFGTLMEFVQENWVTNRSFEISDILADSIGCVLAYVYARHNYSGELPKKIGPDGNRDRNQN